MDYLIQFLSRILSWFVDFVQWVFDWLWSQLLGALMTVLNAIPVPSWLSEAPTVVGSVPASVAFFLRSFEVPSGVAIIFSAYVLRWIIRRIPLIG